MTMQNVTSSFIKKMGYDEDTRSARCEFHDGRVFAYGDMTEGEFNAWLNAPSIGGYFHSHIKKQYRATKVA